MKITVAAVQMPSEPGQIAANIERADALLREARRAGAALAVLPELFNSGYRLFADFAPYAQGSDGATVRHLSRRSREWQMGIVGGFVERDGRHLYDSLALCLPEGSVHVYRKRYLVFWEPFRFRRGRTPLVVSTPWGRVGLAVCADMIRRPVWNDYRGRIDMAVIAAAWPDFACRNRNRVHWLFGGLGPLSAEIPAKVAQDLDVPVIFANQCGTTETTIPLFGLRLVDEIADRFAGRSRICDGRSGTPVIAGAEPRLVLSDLSLTNHRGSRPWPSMFPSVPVAFSSAPA
jgi:N-carbamoylputrescine amidase